jgi:hypothetical protein
LGTPGDAAMALYWSESMTQSMREAGLERKLSWPFILAKSPGCRTL